MHMPSIKEFLAEHREHFEKHETKYNILLGLALQLRRKRKGYRLFSFGRPGACALQMHARNLVLGELSPEDCAKLASYYSNIEYPGVHAPDQVGDWFVQQAGFEHFEAPANMGIFELRSPPKKPPVPGHCKRANDTYLVVKWLCAFHEEIEKRVLSEQEKEHMRQRAEHSAFYFWLVEEEPVAMAAIVREGLISATIGAVFVPPGERGHRYGEAVTAFVAGEILKSGKAYSSLYADMTNPASNKIYARIGYQLLCHSKTFRKKA